MRRTLSKTPQVVYDGHGTIEVSVGEHQRQRTAAYWTLYSPGMMHGGLITGHTGTGKTSRAETIVAAAMSTRRTVFSHFDTSHGLESLPLHQTADPALSEEEEILQTLNRVEHRIRERAQTMVKEGIRRFVPSDTMYGVLLVVHSMDVFSIGTDQWERIAHHGPKAGIAVLAVLPTWTINAFGGSQELRTSVLKGNVLNLQRGEGSGLWPATLNPALNERDGKLRDGSPISVWHAPEETGRLLEEETRVLRPW